VFLLQRGNGHLRVLLDACVELHDHEPAVGTYEQLLQCMSGRVCWVSHCGNDSVSGFCYEALGKAKVYASIGACDKDRG
jgi:hypothetical protein